MALLDSMSTFLLISFLSYVRFQMVPRGDCCAKQYVRVGSNFEPTCASSRTVVFGNGVVQHLYTVNSLDVFHKIIFLRDACFPQDVP